MIEKGFDLIKNKGKLIFASHPENSKKIKLKPHDLISGKKFMVVGEDAVSLIVI